MKNYQKGFVVQLLVIVAIVIIGGGVYYFAKNASVVQKSENSPTNKQNVDPISVGKKVNTSGWKTYTNKAFKLSLQYPTYMTVEELEGDTDFIFVAIQGPKTSSGQPDDKHFPFINMSVANSPQKCGANTSGGIYGGVSGASLKEKKMGDHVFSFTKNLQTTIYGSSDELIYLQKIVPCEAITVNLSPSPSSEITSMGYSQIELVDAIISSIKDI